MMMKIKYFVGISIAILYLSFSPQHVLVTNSAEMMFGQDINQINDNLYIAKSKRADDVYFVMERLTDDKRNIWEKYILDLSNALTFFKKNKNDPIYIGLDKKINDIFHGGTEPFIKGIREAYFGREIKAYFKENGNTNEVWVVYVYSHKEPPLEGLKENLFNHIEVAFTVLTSKDSPFTSHMGIHRSFRYLLNNRDDKEQFPIHGRISVPLHAFAGKIMHIRYPDKLYMITVPMPVMRNMLLNALPAESIWLGDESWMQKIEKNSSNSQRKNLCIKTINQIKGFIKYIAKDKQDNVREILSKSMKEVEECNDVSDNIVFDPFEQFMVELKRKLIDELGKLDVYLDPLRNYVNENQGISTSRYCDNEICRIHLAKILSKKSIISCSSRSASDTGMYSLLYEPNKSTFYWKLKDPQERNILDLERDPESVDKIKKSFFWFFNNMYFIPDETMPYVTIDLNSLAQKFDE